MCLRPAGLGWTLLLPSATAGSRRPTWLEMSPSLNRDISAMITRVKVLQTLMCTSELWARTVIAILWAARHPRLQLKQDDLKMFCDFHLPSAGHYCGVISTSTQGGGLLAARHIPIRSNATASRAGHYGEYPIEGSQRNISFASASFASATPGESIVARHVTVSTSWTDTLAAF